MNNLERFDALSGFTSFDIEGDAYDENLSQMSAQNFACLTHPFAAPDANEAEEQDFVSEWNEDDGETQDDAVE